MSSYPPPPPIPPELREPVGPPRPEPKASPALSGLSGYASASGFIGTVLVFGAIGWGVDALAGSSPWGVMIALLLGMTGATYKMVRENARSS